MVSVRQWNPPVYAECSYDNREGSSNSKVQTIKFTLMVSLGFEGKVLLVLMCMMHLLLHRHNQQVEGTPSKHNGQEPSQSISLKRAFPSA